MGTAARLTRRTPQAVNSENTSRNRMRGRAASPRRTIQSPLGQRSARSPEGKVSRTSAVSGSIHRASCPPRGTSSTATGAGADTAPG